MWSTAYDLSARLRWKPLVVFATLSALVPAAHAQSIATLKGRVTDASGAIVPGATITARAEETGVQRSAISVATGEYQFTFLPVGAYRVEIRAAGFRPEVLPRLVVEVGRTIVQDFQLDVGGVSETVTVDSEVPLIAHSIAVGEIVDQPTLESIPLNGRKVLQLALLAPGSIDAPSGRSPHHAVARAGQPGG
jgi:Carboxypeptidase regulatory-like domain